MHRFLPVFLIICFFSSALQNVASKFKLVRDSLFQGSSQIRMATQHCAEGVGKSFNQTSSALFGDRANQEDLLAVLSELGFEWTVAKESKSTPFHFASRNGHVEVVRLLAEHGTLLGGTSLSWLNSVSATDSDGSTPLLIASQKGHLEVMKSLVELDAEVDAAMKDGTTPAYMAGRPRNKDPDIYHICTSKTGGLENIQI